MHRFVFVIALLTSSASAATWGTKAYAFHGRIAASQGAFSLAHLICMQGTFNRLLMDTPPGQPAEVLIPHHSEVMEIDLAGGAGLHPHAVLFIHLTFAQWLLGFIFMRGVLTRILDECEIDLAAQGLITPGLFPYILRNSGTWKELCSAAEVWSAINYMMKWDRLLCLPREGRIRQPNKALD